MSKQIRITLPNGDVKEFTRGTTGADIAEAIGTGLARSAVACKIDGRLTDLSRPIEADAAVEIVAEGSAEGLQVYRHSTAHLMAQAIRRLYGETAVKLGVGPVIEDGFYYDIDVEKPLSESDLASIEREMEAAVAEDLRIVRREVGREEALRTFERLQDPLKLELIRGLPEDAVISLYEQGEFVDLCRGPHVPSTGRLRAFKLLSVAGAYWRGDASNKMLQRIYGTAFPKPSMLEEHLRLLEEARKRDHRKLGRELELFMFSEEAPGMPFYLPKGTVVRSELEQFSRGLQLLNGYEEVRTPLIMNQRLWEESGHWDHYSENMYFTEADNARHALKPMNCPGHMLIYRSRLRSYRELPLRIAEFGQVHRHEFSGALNGMMRVRTFCQDDAHLFVRPDQIEDEIGRVMELIDRIYGVFGFDYTVELSTRPADYMGELAVWEEAENALRRVLERSGTAYRLNEGDGAFYGPKIDYHIRDALKRSWQCATIQLDFQMPEKFGLSYIGEDNRKHRPVVIHRAVYGSIDRFVGILTEHYAGAFPLWLAPVQAKLLPVSQPQNEYAEDVERQLLQAGIRCEIDGSGEKLGYKIRQARLEKVPYMLILGENERSAGTVSVRGRGEGDIGAVKLHELIARLKGEMESRT
ncbi:threonine--tRNA ligase [Paenibacillus humicola]|uniref:threonine--tRNA ligase n=1 Tax=Paenibacillus humicola TaxID=3110540 RepID=UPI00237C2FA0|nr:threonine--tRNA ligase [Paenibacillus humicola]